MICDSTAENQISDFDFFLGELSTGQIQSQNFKRFFFFYIPWFALNKDVSNLDFLNTSLMIVLIYKNLFIHG